MFKTDKSYIPGAGIVVFLATVLLLLPWLGFTLFYSKGEPREAVVAFSILQNGNWILPTYLGGEIPFKPPFLAWLIAIFAWLFNGGVVNEFVSRLPSVLACTGMIMCGYSWAKRQHGVRFAMIFSLITLSSFEVFRAALVCRLDMVLTSAMVIAIYMLHRLTEDRDVKYKGLRYVAVILLLACAALTKGPIGSLLPCFIIGVYRLFRRRPFWSSFFLMISIALVALIPVSLWFWAAYQQGGEHFYELMYEENLGRLFGTMSYDSHVQPFWYNFTALAAGLLPWTLLPIFLAGGYHRWQRRPLSTSALLSIIAAVLTVGFYTIPESKRSVYLLPAYPFICYGLTCVMNCKLSPRGLRAFAWFIAILAIVAPVAVLVYHIYPLSILRIESIPLWRWIFVAIPVVSGVAWIVNRHSPVAHTLISVWAMYLAYTAAVMPAVLNPQSDKAMAQEIARLAGDNEIIVINPWEQLRPYCSNYYLNDRVRVVRRLEEVLDKPVGTVLIVPSAADTTGLSECFRYIHLTDRSCDSRKPMGAAVKFK